MNTKYPGKIGNREVPTGMQATHLQNVLFRKLRANMALATHDTHATLFDHVLRVLFVRPIKEMIRIHALRVVAFVADQVRRLLASVEKPHDSMRAMILVLGAKNTITIIAKAAIPKPAGGWLSAFKTAIKSINVFSRERFKVHAQHYGVTGNFATAFLLAVCIGINSHAATGTWNGVAFSAWNGVAQTAWNGSGVSCAGGASGYASGLKGLWHLDEGAGLSRADSVNSTTLSDNATVGSGTGKISNAATYGTGNTSQYLSAASNANITAGGDFTVGLWFNLSDTSANHGLISKGAQDAYEEYSILYNAGSDACRAFMRDLGTTVLSSVSFTTTGVWHFVAIVYDSGAATFRIYVDGTVDTTSSVPGANTTTTGTLKLGRTNGATWMEGSLDNAFFYQKALSNSELNTIYNSGNGLAGP